jgi:hypothetical protein
MNHRVPPDDFDTFEAACRAADAKRNGKAATHHNHVSGAEKAKAPLWRCGFNPVNDRLTSCRRS